MISLHTTVQNSPWIGGIKGGINLPSYYPILPYVSQIKEGENKGGIYD